MSGGGKWSWHIWKWEYGSGYETEAAFSEHLHRFPRQPFFIPCCEVHSPGLYQPALLTQGQPPLPLTEYWLYSI